MKFIFYRDKKKKYLVKKFEFKRLFIFSIIKSYLFSYVLRTLLYNYFIMNYPKSGITLIKNRCYLTNSARSVRVVENLIYSRHTLQKKLSFGNLFPFFRSSW